jgi:hypothetical protein
VALLAPAVGLELLLFEIGVGVLACLKLWLYVENGGSCGLGLLEVAAGALLVCAHTGVARWLWSLSWGLLAAVSALALAVAVLTFALERRLGHRELRTAAASVLLSLVPWATAAAWAAVTVLRAAVTARQVWRLLAGLAEARAALGRGELGREHRRERRLRALTDHFAEVLDARFKYISAGVAAGWAHGWDAAFGKDAATWRTRLAAAAAALTSTAVAWSGRIVYGVPRLVGRTEGWAALRFPAASSH